MLVFPLTDLFDAPVLRTRRPGAILLARWPMKKAAGAGYIRDGLVALIHLDQVAADDLAGCAAR
jgi:hypothetical protein